MGRALKFRIFLLVKIGPWEKSKNRAPFFAESTKEFLINQKPQIVWNDLASWGAVLLDRVSEYRMVHWGGVPDELVLPCQSRHFFSNSVVALLVRLPRRHRPESSFIVLHRHDDVSNCERREVSLLDASKPCGASYERMPSASNIADLPPRGENGAAALMIDCNFRGDISIPSEVTFPCLMVPSSQKRKVSVETEIKSVLRLTNISISLMGVAFDFDIDSEAMFAVRYGGNKVSAPEPVHLLDFTKYVFFVEIHWCQRQQQQK